MPPAAPAAERLPALGFNHVKSEWVVGFDGDHLDWHGLRDLEWMREAAAPYFRVRFRLDIVDPNGDGVLDSWGQLDNVVRQAALRDVLVLPLLIRLQERPGRRALYVPPRTVRDRARFARFARAAVRRYGPNGRLWQVCVCRPRPIRVWEVWNEENIEPYWSPPNPVEYGRLLLDVGAALRRADPEARVVFGGLAYGGRRNWDPDHFLTTVIERYGVAAFDAAAVHFYGDVLPLAALERLGRTADTLKRHASTSSGAPRHQLWLTEFGWPAHDPSSEQTQRSNLALFLAELTTKRQAWNLGPLFWYPLRDFYAPTRAEHWLGLRRTRRDEGDRGAKPAWHVYARYGRIAGTRPLPRVR